MCPKPFSFRNTGECSQMFDETVNYVGDIFLYKYALLHVSYHSHNHKQSDKIKVKVIKSRIDFNSDIAASQLACTYDFRSNCFSPLKSVLC